MEKYEEGKTSRPQKLSDIEINLFKMFAMLSESKVRVLMAKKDKSFTCRNSLKLWSLRNNNPQQWTVVWQGHRYQTGWFSYINTSFKASTETNTNFTQFSQMYEIKQSTYCPRALFKASKHSTAIWALALSSSPDALDRFCCACSSCWLTACKKENR